MPEKRNITRQDLDLKGRIMQAGIEVKEPHLWKPIGSYTDYGMRIVLDDTDIVVPFVQPLPNPQALTQVVVDDYSVTVSEAGKVVATGRLEKQPSWCDG